MIVTPIPQEQSKGDRSGSIPVSDRLFPLQLKINLLRNGELVIASVASGWLSRASMIPEMVGRRLAPQTSAVASRSLGCNAKLLAEPNESH